jgi:hypothetical protein
LSIKVTLLLQSNSEEIERISFVQHYKRKVVKSKAAIQPFVTKIIMADDSKEEETGSQGTRKSTKNNEGSNGSYTRGAYRGNRNDKNCKETLQSLVTTFTNMEPEIKVIGSPERQRQ